MSAGSVLVIDDDPTLVKVVKLTLEASGFQVHGARDGAQALELLALHSLPIDVAIIDYELQGSRLGDLLEQIRSQHRPIRAIVTSGYSLDLIEELSGTLPSGVEFLKKPFLPKELVAVVRRAFMKTAATGS